MGWKAFPESCVFGVKLKSCSFSSGLCGMSSMFGPLWISACVRARTCAPWVGFWSCLHHCGPPNGKVLTVPSLLLPSNTHTYAHTRTHTYTHIHSGSRDDLPVPLQCYSASNFSFIQTRTAFPSSVFNPQEETGENRRGTFYFTAIICHFHCFFHLKRIKIHWNEPTWNNKQRYLASEVEIKWGKSTFTKETNEITLVPDWSVSVPVDWSKSPICTQNGTGINGKRN